MMAQLDIPALTGDPKTWLVLLGGAFVTLVVGRFFQAFKSGEGIVGAVKAVIYGTNTKTPPPADKP